MGDALEVKPLLQPRRVAELAPEAQVFKAYKSTFKHQENSRIVSLAYCPTSPYRLAVVSGTKVGLWQKLAGKDEHEESSTLTKFKDLTTCVNFRSDGRLMLAGEAGGSCAVIETDSKNVLRRLRGHGDAVTCASFATADRSKVATGSKDGKLRIWDVATADLLQTVDAHGDSMKVLTAGPGGPDSWITAGYDGKVRVWDVRVAPRESQTEKASPVASIDHGHPIEAGTTFPGGTLFVSAGGPAVKVWDMALAGRPVQELPDAHSKVVMDVCLDTNASVLLTASFDGLAKVYHAADLQHIWTYRLPGPATSIAWRPDDKGFTVGLDDGSWHYRSKKVSAESKKAAEAEDKPKRKWKYREGHLRGDEYQPDDDDEVIDMPGRKRKREPKLDYFFRKFEYKKVAEYMFVSADANLGSSITEELLERGYLSESMTELGEELCLRGLRWFLRAFAVGDSLQRARFEEALHSLIEGNRCLRPPCTPELIDVMRKLEEKVAQEMRVQDALIETSGMIEALLNS